MLNKKIMAASLSIAMLISLAGCSGGTSSRQQEEDSIQRTEQTDAQNEIEINETVDNREDGEHAIEADGVTRSYSNVMVTKTGEASGDEADFYGANSAIFATNGRTLDLSEIIVKTNGTHANRIFSYGEGTTVTVSDSVIETSGNCSGGIMTTGGGTMIANDLSVHTTGNSSRAIRSDRGGGTVTVTGGSYTTDGVGSPAIYSTADITVNEASLTSTSSQGVVVEGKNSVTLNNVTLSATNNSKNSDKSDWYQAVMLYQSMSGDARDGTSSFSMTGGSLDNYNGDIFFVNNTVAVIDLNNARITNHDPDGVFLRARAAGWGNEGSNGGQVTLTAKHQNINGNILVDGVSNLNLYLDESSVFEGAINPDGEEGDVYVEISGSAVWKLTGDSYITSLTCSRDSIDLNGYKLYIDGEEYREGSTMNGEAIETVVYSSSHGTDMSPPDGQGGPGGDKPDGDPPQMPGGGQPPEKPSGED